MFEGSEPRSTRPIISHVTALKQHANHGHLILAAQDTKAVGTIAATLLMKLLPQHGDPVVALPTGSTPIDMYKEIALKALELPRDHSHHPARWITFNLDEYDGLQYNDPQSYHAFMQEHFFGPNHTAADRNFFPDPKAPKAYDTLIRSYGGIDVLVAGIGVNESPHIAFQEKGSSFEGRTSLVKLSASTIQANARFFEGRPECVPTHAASMGLRTIQDARNILILASGEHKARSVYEALTLPPSTDRPASCLQGHHSVTWIVCPKIAAYLSAHGVEL